MGDELEDKTAHCTGGTDRIESAYCASCGETEAVWTDAKHRECIDCGQTVYDDRETFETVGKQLGGRFAATGGDL